MKHWVLFGAQGDPMIEADRPTIASMLRSAGYRTAMFGKWHVGLRYRQSNGRPASGWEDADLTKPLHTSPVDHGFEIAKFTSRSHGTSGPNAEETNPRKKKLSGPGHVDGRTVLAASGDGKKLIETGDNAYALSKLGSRHSDNAIQFLESHVQSTATKESPFFVYYPANSNHGPYTPDDSIGGKSVKGRSRTKSGKPMNARYDFIYENDVALGRLMDWLEQTDDPRSPEQKLIYNTLLIFTSDNGAENKSKLATGPFRSHKGSAFEGGHRVPFIASWPAGGVGDGSAESTGLTNATTICHTDMYATFAEAADTVLPNLRLGEKGAEDSSSVLAAFKGEEWTRTTPLIFNDHNEAKEDHAEAAIRLDNPTIDDEEFRGQWKLFFAPDLIRFGVAKPYALYNLKVDQREKTNLIDRDEYAPLVAYLCDLAELHRNSGGHRYTEFTPLKSTTFHFTDGPDSESDAIHGNLVKGFKLIAEDDSVALMFAGYQRATNDNGETLIEPFQTHRFICDQNGLGVTSSEKEGDSQIDGGEAVLLSFSRDVIVDSIALFAGDGTCGGSYQIGSGAPLAIYCVDADNDAKDQHGNLSDIGLIKVGETLRLDSSPHYGVEQAGAWKLQSITLRVLE